MPQEPTRFSEELGHEVRSDHWPAQGRSSYTLALEALADGRRDDAAALARMTVQEAVEAYELYVLWLDQLPAFLADRGVAGEEFIRARTASSTTKARLQAGWIEYLGLIDNFETLSSKEISQAAGTLERARSTWREAHDPATHQLAALFALASRLLGEDQIGGIWDGLLSHYYARLGHNYDPATHPWSRTLERLGLDAFEAARGHLSGPGRDGSLTVTEEADRWVLRFAPCGSGGLTYPSAEAPDRDPREFTSQEHDWAWRTKGVCLYCAHCCQLQQRAPIERIGIPLRVIEPPVRPSEGEPGRALCTWSIYKDPAKLPASAWSDVGFTPPE